MVTLFCLLNFSNGMQWVTFAPIATKFKQIYKTDSFHVDSFSMIYMIVYPLVTFPSSYIIDNKSIRLGITISAILTGIGGFTKIFINDSMYWAYIGQTLSGIAQPFILNSPGKIASTWFDENKV
jgi:fucose permease